MLTPAPPLTSEIESSVAPVAYAARSRRVLSYAIDSLFVAIPTTAAFTYWVFANLTGIREFATLSAPFSCTGSPLRSVTCSDAHHSVTLALPTTLLLAMFAAQALWFAYAAWLLSRGSQTPGMRYLHLRVVAEVSKGTISHAQALSRSAWCAIFVLGNALLLLPILIDAAWMFFDARHRAVHDRLSHTVVIAI